MNPSSASKLSELAFQYGPFFFSLLFILVVVRWAYKVSKEVAARQPPASAKDVSAARFVFLASFVVGVVLVAASVVWWFGYRPRTFVFRGEIEDLQDYESVASDGMYFRPELKCIIDDIPLRNEHFAVIRDSPFKSGEVFDLEFSKNKSKRNKFQVSYDPSDAYPKYMVAWDDSSHTNTLKRDAVPVKALLLEPFVKSVVYAAAPQESSPAKAGNRQTHSNAQFDPAIQTLQDARSDVGSKLVALDALRKMPNSTLSKKSAQMPEPPLATVLDLTRHSDKELSFKAKEVLSGINYTDFVAAELKSPDKEAERDGQIIFGKLSQDDQSRVLNQLEPSTAARWRARAVPLAQAQQIAPTASPQGDRYYVKATWDPANAFTVDCLASLFNKELITDRTLDQERSLMKNRKERLVYWYDKEWSVGIAGKIKACGGNAAYVHPTSAE